MFIGATSALYLVSKGVQPEHVFYLKAFQAGAMLVIQVPLGWISDRVSRRWPIAIAIILGALWLLLTAVSTSIPTLYVAELCNALSLALMAGALHAEFVDRSIAHHKDNNRNESDNLAQDISRLNNFEFRAMAVSAGLGGLIYGIAPTTTWLIASAACLVIFTSYVWYSAKFPPLPEAEADGTVRTLRLMIRTLRDSHRGVLAPLLVGGILYAGFQIAIQYWQLAINRSGPVLSSEFATGIVFGLIFVIILVVQSGISGLLSSFDRKRWLLPVAIAVPPLLWFAILYLPLWPVQAAATVLYFWIYRAAFVYYDVIMNKGVAEGTRATVLATRATSGRLIALACAPIVSSAVAVMGPAGAVLVVSALSVLAGLLALLNPETTRSN